MDTVVFQNQMCHANVRSVNTSREKYLALQSQIIVYADRCTTYSLGCGVYEGAKSMRVSPEGHKGSIPHEKWLW